MTLSLTNDSIKRDLSIARENVTRKWSVKVSLPRGSQQTHWRVTGHFRNHELLVLCYHKYV